MIEAVSENNILEYEGFLQRHPCGSYLQSSVWSRQNPSDHWSGLIRRNRRHKITGVCSVLIREVPLLPYQMLYICRGPVCEQEHEETLRELLDGIRRLAKKESAALVRMDAPFIAGDKIVEDIFSEFKYRPVVYKKDASPLYPSASWVYDTASGWDKFQTEMNPLHIRSIETAVRHGIDIRSGGKALIPEFSSLMDRRALQDDEVYHPQEYYANVMHNFGTQARIFLAFRENKPIAGALMLRYGSRYYCAAEADLSDPTLHAGELLRAAILQTACGLGCRSCEFPGVPAESEDPQYKLFAGFGGTPVQHPGEYDWFRHPLGGRLCRFITRITDRIARTKYFISIR